MRGAAMTRHLASAPKIYGWAQQEEDSSAHALHLLKANLRTLE